MNRVLILLLACAAMHFTGKNPVDYVLNAVEVIDRLFFGIQDLHYNLSDAYARKVSSAMEHLKMDIRDRARNAALNSLRANMCMDKMEKSVSAELTIGHRRISAELSFLSKDFVADPRTKRLLEKLKLIKLLQAAGDGEVWTHITQFSKKWVLLQEKVWNHRMGTELGRVAVEIGQNMTYELQKMWQHEKERPQRVGQFITDMVVMFTAVNFMGLFQQ